MENDLNEMLSQACGVKFGTGWIRAIFPATLIYVAEGTYVTGGIRSADRLLESPWSLDQANGTVTVGDATEVQLDYVQKMIAEELSPELSAPIVMKNAEKRIVYGPVLVPGEPDSDGEVLTAGKIEEVAHAFLKDYGNVDLQHSLNNVGRPVESYLMPVDVELPGLDGPVAVPKGTWMAGAYVEDDQAWQDVKDRKLAGFSVMGVRKAAMKELEGGAVKEAAFKRILIGDLGEDWVATHVSLVTRPAVPKAKFLAIKSKKEGFMARVFSKKDKTKEVTDMDPEEIKGAIKEAMVDAGKTTDEALKAIDEKIEALKTQVDELAKEPEVPKPAEKTEPEPEETPDAEALKAKITELETGIEEFKAEVTKKLAPKAASKGLKGQDGTPEAAVKDFGDRDGFGRKNRK